jgi:hypothetical protein
MTPNQLGHRYSEYIKTQFTTEPKYLTDDEVVDQIKILTTITDYLYARGDCAMAVIYLNFDLGTFNSMLQARKSHKNHAN